MECINLMFAAIEDISIDSNAMLTVVWVGVEYYQLDMAL